MRAVIQRVSSAALVADGIPQGVMGQGLLVLVGVKESDDQSVMRYMLEKIASMRIFEDENGHMNLSARDLSYSLYLVPNFTLYGDCRHGRRPGFTAGAPVHVAESLFAQFVDLAQKEAGVPVFTGVFQAHMIITPTLDGPVTLLLDSDKLF
ncbi:MAG: D-tyrosyl-tRNA(Tyr) deacylase [Firmicutes bacterium]|nr:D-tyrosyl-tRNA(Tyr) deacylase [Bacillota bacterium]